MTGQSVDYGRGAFEFIERVCALRSATDVVRLFHEALGRFGYETFIITGLPNGGQRFEQLVLLKHWPAGWFDLYTREGYILDDPVAVQCRRTVEPFEWASAPYDPQRHPRSAEIMRRAADFGMTNGLCVPIHGFVGLEACVSAGGSDLDLSPQAKAAVHLMAIYACNRARQLLAPLAEPRKPLLTSREREVMTWTAMGKSAWEIGCILRISAPTVNKHVASAMHKLGAANKTHAVARAIERREVNI
ncbi:LuxR family transcriptional regulator [Chelatococcus sp. SYSU_G07232]|uniref:LuxR family transcriptional regulator n=1 Tax=Chelatococcus albus TaxID=3047466 RepID=A0ABT7AEP4_9HYPH|nr:LuxR family transcriptional regulator [Chelatococcus sp. SYSU_G07232]MDJ1157570.1 LuxR family transcriptional regulator [Chelatococcus sp. SYSU_G07232]